MRKTNNFQTNENSEEANKFIRPSENKSIRFDNTAKIGLIVIIVLCVVFAAIVTSYFISNNNNLPVVTYKNVFIDVNGDGKVDFVIKVETILNQPQQEVTPPLEPSP